MSLYVEGRALFRTVMGKVFFLIAVHRAPHTQRRPLREAGCSTAVSEITLRDLFSVGFTEGETHPHPAIPSDVSRQNLSLHPGAPGEMPEWRMPPQPRDAPCQMWVRVKGVEMRTRAFILPNHHAWHKQVLVPGFRSGGKDEVESSCSHHSNQEAKKGSTARSQDPEEKPLIMDFLQLDPASSFASSPSCHRVITPLRAG